MTNKCRRVLVGGLTRPVQGLFTLDLLAPWTRPVQGVFTLDLLTRWRVLANYYLCSPLYNPYLTYITIHLPHYCPLCSCYVG